MATSDREQFLQALTPLCTDVPTDVLRDFVMRMDAEYLRRFPVSMIGQHVRLASTLTPDPLHSAFYDSHPPASIRIARLVQQPA